MLVVSWGVSVGASYTWGRGARAALPAAPPPPRAAAPPPPPKAAARSSAPALTFEDLVANSIASKEELLGRKLTDAEKGALVAKLEALMK